MASLENNTLEIALAPISLADVARDISELVEESKIRASPLGVEIESDIVLPPEQAINADLRRLHEVISNLLENAINYSGDGGHVLVHATVDRRNMMISIRDYGIGIPREDQAKIFSKLFRAINARRAQSTGTGLGLYLSKKFVEAHNGSLVFDSKRQRDGFCVHDSITTRYFCRGIFQTNLAYSFVFWYTCRIASKKNNYFIWIQ